MSLIQQIRDRAAWIVFGAIALSLIAFIVQDAFVRKGSSVSTSSLIGKVNGNTITKDVFDKKVSFIEQANGGQSKRDQLISSVWEYMVENAVMKQEYEKLGITVTSKELSDILFGDNPPQWMQQAFTNPQTGQFDVDAAKKQFSQIKAKADDPQVTNLYEGYIQPTIDQTLRQKYQSLLTGAIYVPKWMAEKMNADNNTIAKISYVSAPYSMILDSAIKVTDEDINAYVKKHPTEYLKEDETRAVSYVSFDAAPNSMDSANLLNDLSLLKSSFAASTDEKIYLNTKGSEMPYYNSYVSKNEIKQRLKDSFFTQPVGGIYGPYIDGSNFVLAKVVGIKTIADSARVRHILVATHQQDQQTGQLTRIRDDSSAIHRLDSAIALLKNGASYDSICSAYSDDPGSKDKGGVYDYFPSGQMDEGFNDYAFTGPLNVPKTVQTVFGYHYLEVLGQKGSATGYKIAYMAKPLIASQETVDGANNAAIQFSATSKDQKMFNENALKSKKEVMPSQEFKENDFQIPSVGESRELIRWAYKGKAGDISQPIQIADKYIVAILSTINPKGLPSAASVRPMVETIIRNEKKAQALIASKLKGNTLEEISKNAGEPVKVADSISFQGFVIASIGNEAKVLGAAFNKLIQGKISTPIAGNTGVFVIRGEGISAAASLGGSAETEKATIINTLKQQIGYKSINTLRKVAVIKDYRSEFY